MSKDTIVFIYEGEDTEKKILDNLHSNFFEFPIQHKYIFLPFKTDIYELWKKLQKDNYETDIIDLLMEKDNTIKTEVELVGKKSISEIYLFFDYDGHATCADDEIIREMLETFNNETDYGKLYISYPMVESVKDLKKNDKCNRRCSVLAKSNIGYKELVGDDTDFQNLKRLCVSDWHLIIKHYISKSNCIIKSTVDCDVESFKLPKYCDFIEKTNQSAIFENQFIKFIQPRNEVAVLSCFPFFLIDYLGENLYNDLT